MCGYPLTKAKSECLFAFFILNTYLCLTLNHNETYTLAMRYKQILFGLILFAILGVFFISSSFNYFNFPETILRIKSVIREVYLRSSGNF